METVERDYTPKGVVFYYVYKPLAHPEFNNYVRPVTIEERLMHVAEAKRVLGTSVKWLADTMNNDFHQAMGRTPNGELLIDPQGIIVAGRRWSNPNELRADLERLVGPVDTQTRVADLDLPSHPPAPTVVKGIVPRIEKPAGMMSIEIDAILESSEHPFFVKIRAEGDKGVLTNGNGMIYLGFHLDPLYKVHWNNEAGPVTFQFKTPPGVTVTPTNGVGPEVAEAADADPREFLVSVTAKHTDQPLELNVFYYACDDALTFCVPVNQSYRIMLEQDVSHGWSIQTSADGPIMNGSRRGRRGSGRPGRPDFNLLDADGDGRISRDEAPARMGRFFERLDTNGDGVISEDELQRRPRR